MFCASVFFFICRVRFRTIPHFNPQGTHFPHREKTELLINHVHSNLISTWVSRGYLKFWISVSCIFSLVCDWPTWEPGSPEKIVTMKLSNSQIVYCCQIVTMKLSNYHCQTVKLFRCVKLSNCHYHCQILKLSLVKLFNLVIC